MVESSTEARRANLSLRVEGVAPHDELLFKSLVRLLSYRTQHNWTFSTGAADLRILGEDLLKSEDTNAPANVLWVGHSEQQDRSPFLHLPIHANELELLLNRLGSNILQNQATAPKAWPPSIRRDEMFTLNRWPPAAMLDTPARLKLATLMTGRPLSMDTLALRSGATLNDCEMFCQALDRAGMLQRHDINAQAPSDRQINQDQALKVKPDLSLLARIRRRLGI